MMKYENIDRIAPENLGEGLHRFPDTSGVYWTDASLDASEYNSAGREEIARNLGIPLRDIVSFSPKNHTNEVVIVDTEAGISTLESIEVDASRISRRILSAGWGEPVRPGVSNPEFGAERESYDGIILVGRDNFLGKHILVTGADCTGVCLRGMLESGEEFIAGFHGGRKGTMSGIATNMASRLRFLGIKTGSVEVFVSPAAQSIEVDLGTLVLESGGDNSWRVRSITQPYEKNGEEKVLYNNQSDTTRRFIEDLAIEPEQVHLVDLDTLTNGSLHSYRRSHISARNSIIITFSE